MHLCGFSSYLQMHQTLIWLIDSCQKCYLDLKTIIDLLCDWNHIKEHDNHHLQYTFCYCYVLSPLPHNAYSTTTDLKLYIPLILDNFFPRSFITDLFRWKISIIQFILENCACWNAVGILLFWLSSTT